MTAEKKKEQEKRKECSIGQFCLYEPWRLVNHSERFEDATGYLLNFRARKGLLFESVRQLLPRYRDKLTVDRWAPGFRRPKGGQAEFWTFLLASSCTRGQLDWRGTLFLRRWPYAAS